jgi:hypothetical protein
MTLTLASNPRLVVQHWDPEEAAHPRSVTRKYFAISSAAQQLVLRGANGGTANWRAALPTAIDSALAATAIDHACARIRSFKSLDSDWDGEGAEAPSPALLDAALRFLRRLQPWHPTPSATLDAYGQPVIEFRDQGTSFFGKVRFVSPTRVELFVSAGNDESYIEGHLASVDVLRFLSDQMQITLQP